MRLLVVLLLLCGWLCHAFRCATHSSYNPPTVMEWPEECSIPTRTYLVSRHGIREPSSNIIAASKKLEKRVQNSTLPWLRKWRAEFYDPKDLAERGARELYNAGVRMRTRMGGETVLEQDVDARSTHVRRAARSGVAFLQGLFFDYEFPSSPYVSMEPKASDDLLRFFDLCPQYVDEEKSSLARRQQTEFGAVFLPRLAEGLTTKTGLPLSSSDARLCWDICAFELALLNRSDLFCSLFSADDVEMLNYFEDLAYYWKRGYGMPITSVIASPIIRDIVSMWTSSSSPATILRFAHAETIMPLLTRLQLFKDSFPLMSSTPPRLWKQRLWRTERISPFQANVAFYQAQCNGQVSVVTQVNERTVSLPLFSQSSTNASYVALDDFLAWAQSVQNSDADLCQSSSRDAGNNSPLSSSLVAVISALGIVAALSLTLAVVCFVAWIKERRKKKLLGQRLIN